MIYDIVCNANGMFAYDLELKSYNSKTITFQSNVYPTKYIVDRKSGAVDYSPNGKEKNILEICHLKGWKL